MIFWGFKNLSDFCCWGRSALYNTITCESKLSWGKALLQKRHSLFRVMNSWRKLWRIGFDETSILIRARVLAAR